MNELIEYVCQFDEAPTVKDVAEHFGCSVNTIKNRASKTDELDIEKGCIYYVIE